MESPQELFYQGLQHGLLASWTQIRQLSTALPTQLQSFRERTIPRESFLQLIETKTNQTIPSTTPLNLFYLLFGLGLCIVCMAACTEDSLLGCARRLHHARLLPIVFFGNLMCDAPIEKP